MTRRMVPAVIAARDRIGTAASRLSDALHTAAVTLHDTGHTLSLWVIDWDERTDEIEAAATPPPPPERPVRYIEFSRVLTSSEAEAFRKALGDGVEIRAKMVDR